MKLVILSTFLLLMPTVAEAQPCPVPSTAQAVAAITSLNEQYITAARDGDAAWFRAHMVDDVLVILSDGRRLHKPAFLELAKPGGYKSLVAKDVSVRVYGTMAQVDASSHWERPNGTSGVSRYIDTYVWRDCRWQVVSAQITALPSTR